MKKILNCMLPLALPFALVADDATPTGVCGEIVAVFRDGMRCTAARATASVR